MLSKSAQYYRDNPKARAKKAKTDKKINERLIEGIDYTVSGVTVTFTVALSLDDIEVVYEY